MYQQRKRYERPEVAPLGPASKLTLGAIGCEPDGHCCNKAPAET